MKNMLKRATAIVLSIAMLCSLLVVTASAEGATATVTLQADKTENLQPGDIISVNVNFTNNTDSVIYLAGVQAKVLYDSNILELYSETEYDEALGENVTVDYWKGENEFFKSNSWSYTFGNPTSGEVTVAAGGPVSQKVYATKSSGTAPTRTFATLKFKVLADAESCQTNFSFSTEYNNQVTKYPAKDATRDEVINDIDYSNVLTTVSIIGVAPTIRSVELQSNSVTVNGSNKQTVQAKATSAKGTDLTNSVTWSIGTPENGGGVSIAENGTITVAANAKAGEYTVYANKNSSGGGGGGSGSTNRPRSAETRSTVQGSAQATLTVTRAPSENKSIAISANKSKIEIPTGNTSETAIFKATFRDQYGDEKTADSVNWSITPSVDGVSIDNRNGVVTVSKDAKNGISNSTEFTITAKSGDLTQDSKLTVKRAAAQAKSIELGTVNNMTVPADGADAKTATVTATVKDQYDTPISNPTVAWSITPAVEGVSIDSTGKITVTNAAKAGIDDTTGKEFTVTATSGTAKAEKKFHVKRDTQTAKALVICKNSVELSGDTDTVIIPTTDTANDYTYTVKISDQYGAEMTADSTVTISAIGDASADAISGNKLTIRKTATKDKKYKVTATCGTLTKEVTVTVKDIDITWPTVSEKTGTYGDKWSDIITFSGGSAKLNGTDVPGTFTLKNADDVPDVGATYQFVFNSSDGTYTVESDPQTAEIAQKNLTITAGSASKQYDGKALTKNAVTDCTVTGLVNDDVLTAVTVNGSATNVADTATGNNKVSAATIKHGDVDKTTNYNISYDNGTLTITKAPLTIKAKDKTITYGDAVANSGVEYAGLVNSEDGATVVSGLIYDYNYERYGNVGDYTITPKGATAANYEITYQPGKLTVNKKTVGLTWSNTESLYYNGEAKNVTATATELVNSDNISVTVVGGKETAVGNYTAKATALTGDKAGNYALPTDVTNVTKNYQIQAALSASDLTIAPTTVTATIDGLTIKLVGYKNASGTVTVSKGKDTAADNKLTVNGVTYKIDASGVKDVDTDKINVSTTVEVTLPEGASSELSAVKNTATTVSGLENALADLIAKAGDTLPDGATKVEVQAILNIQAVSYTGTSLKLNIEPQIKYTYKNGDKTVQEKTVDVNNSDIKAPVTISVNLPSSFAPNFAKHGSEMIPVTMSGTVATWKQSSFSEVELVKDDRSATVNFTFADDHAQTITYGPADIGKAFPTDSKDGYTFNGWTIGDKTYTTLTEEALTRLNGTTAQNAQASFTQKSNNGGNHGGSGGSGVSTYPVSVTTPKNGKVTVSPSNAAKGAAVTVTVTPDSGYEMDKLTVTDASGKTISTTDKGNGKFTFTMPNGKVSVSATFKQTTVTPPSTGFMDVPASAYYADAVKWAVEKGITTGTSATTFSPEASCTRAQMVTFLWRAAGSPAPKATTTAFTDLDKSAYYYDAVLWAVEQGITTGTSATTFSPNATVTRGQTVTFLYRFAGQPAVSGSSSFTDVNSSDYYAAAVQWAKEQGITSGTSDTTFSPTSDCTRGQIVTFLYRQLAK